MVADIAIVICRLLPLEERYFFLLAFAPATSAKWQEFVRIVIEQEISELQNIVTRMRPLEVSMVIEERKQSKQLTANQIETYQKAGENVMSFIRSLSIEQQAAFITRVFPLQDIVKGLTPEQRKEFLNLLMEQQKEADKSSELKADQNPN